jgi:hypothetical protein
LLDGITEKGKQWHRGRRDSKDNKRPFHLGILDEGRVLRALEIGPYGSTEDVTGREQSKPPKPRPEPADGGEWQSPE